MTIGTMLDAIPQSLMCKSEAIGDYRLKADNCYAGAKKLAQALSELAEPEKAKAS